MPTCTVACPSEDHGSCHCDEGFLRPVKIGRASVCLGILLLVGLALRVVGITRGASDFVLPEDQGNSCA